MTFNTIGRPQRARLFGLDSTGTNIGLLPDDAAGRPGSLGWHALGSYYSIAPADTGADVSPLYDGDDGNPNNMLNPTWNSTYKGYALISVRLYPATFGINAPQTTFHATPLLHVVARERGREPGTPGSVIGRLDLDWPSTPQDLATAPSLLY